MKNERLDYSVEQLESRAMLALAVSVNGNNLTATGTGEGEVFNLSMQDGTVHYSLGSTGIDTGLESIRNLTVNMKGADSQIAINWNITVTNRTVVKVKTGPNFVNVGGTHRNLTITGGNGDDLVEINGAAVTNKLVVKLKGGNDSFAINLWGYQYANVNGQFDELGPNDITSKGNINLGSGDDEVRLKFEDSQMDESNVTDLLTSEGYASLDEMFTDWSVPRFKTVNGASGTDVVDLASLDDLLQSSGKVRNFET